MPALSGRGAALCALACTVAGLWLGFPNSLISLPLAALLYPAGLALLGHVAPSPRRAFFYGLGAGTIGYCLALSWLSLPLSQVGGFPLPLAAFFAFLACAYMATFCGILAALAKRFWQPGSLAATLALALCWYFVDFAYARGIGFPWLPVSGALAPWPMLVQACDIFGAELVGALWVLAALLFAGSLCAKKLAHALMGLALTGLLAGYGAYSLSQAPKLAEPKGPASFPVAMIEGNVDQNVKWTEPYKRQTVEAYIELTQNALAELARTTTPEDYARGIIVWPETAMPFDLEGSRLTGRIVQTARNATIPLITGAPAAQRNMSGGTDIFNRCWLISPDGLAAGSYDKEHLVPFGEFIPPILDWPLFAPLLQEVGAYTPGTRQDPLRYKHLALGPLICYEGIFPWLAQERVKKGATVLLDISNDGWFGDTAAPRQHLYLSALRSIEQHRWLIRGTNTGISCIIDAHGRIVTQGGQFNAGHVLGRAEASTAITIFHKACPFIPPCCALILALLGWRLFRKPDSNAAN